LAAHILTHSVAALHVRPTSQYTTVA
jgi:hypothetical protein